MIKTDICDLLGIEYPIFQGGMAWLGTAELAAAVSEGGGLGIIGAGWSGRVLKQSERAVKSADKSADVARKEASADASSMDRVVQSGDDLARRGESLMEESERLIREAGREPSTGNK